MTDRPSIHHAAAKGFGAAAEAYQESRPDYPAALADWLRDELGLAPGRVVVDLGAGTGKFTPLLNATGARVVALDRGTHQAAFVHRAGTGAAPEPRYDVTALYALEVPLSGRAVGVGPAGLPAP